MPCALTIRFTDFTTIGKQQTRKEYTNQSDEIFNEAVSILDSLELNQPVRLLGVRIKNFCYQRLQLPLFEEKGCKVLATSTMNEVNDRFGSFKVKYGSVMDNDEKSLFVISPV
jgi:DNA polymerase-4